MNLFLAGPLVTRWVGTTQLVDRRTRDRKVTGSDTGRSDGRIFFSGANCLGSL